jgi:hypothetical protein
MTNPTFRHIEAKLRFGGMTTAQWAGVVVGALLAFAWWKLSPLGTHLTLFVGIYVAGIPGVCAYVGSQSDYDPWLHARAFLHWQRTQDRYAPGPGRETPGYALLAPPPAPADPHADRALEPIDVATLWES